MGPVPEPGPPRGETATRAEAQLVARYSSARAACVCDCNEACEVGGLEDQAGDVRETAQ